MIDKFFNKITEALGTNTAIIAFLLIAFAPLAFQLPDNILNWQAWLSQSCIQLVALAVLQKGTRMEGQKTSALLQETHDIVICELKEIKAIHKEIDGEMVGASTD